MSRQGRCRRHTAASPDKPIIGRPSRCACYAVVHLPPVTGTRVSTSSDTLKPFLLEEHGIRGFIVLMDATWRAVLERHQYPPALRDHIDELMATAALLTATLHYRGTLSILLKGSGPVRWLWVECTSDYGLRATAHWSGDAPEGASLRDLVGEALYTHTLDPTEGSERYQGIVAVEGDTLASVLVGFLVCLVQLTSRFWLLV